MDYEVRDITPADYIPAEDGRLRINPELRDRLHCAFVVSLREFADEAGWMMRIVHEKDHQMNFPAVTVFPPGQEDQSVLTGYRIEGGLLNELTPEQAMEPFVDRYFELVTIKQRSVAGPLDMYMPAILLEKVDGHFFLGGQSGAYDPHDWAKLMMKMAITLHEHREAMEAIERKYANVPLH